MCVSCTQSKPQLVLAALHTLLSARSCHVCLLHTRLSLHAPVMCVSCIQGCHCTLLSCVSLAYRAGIARSCHVCLLHTGLALHAPVMCVSCIQGCHCTLLSCVSLAYRAVIAHSCHVCLLHTGLALHTPVMCVSCIQGWLQSVSSPRGF